MNIKNIFKKPKQQQQAYVDIKYSKLDHIGKVTRIPIVQKEQLDNINNQIANFQNELTKIKNKVNLNNPLIKTEELIVSNGDSLIDYQEIDINNNKYGLFSWMRNRSFAIDIPSIFIPLPKNHSENQITYVYCYITAIKIYHPAVGVNRLLETIKVPTTYVGFVNWYPTTGNSGFTLNLPYTNWDSNPDSKVVNWVFKLENGKSFINTLRNAKIKLEVEMHSIPYIFKG